MPDKTSARIYDVPGIGVEAAMARRRTRASDIPTVFQTLGLLFHQDIDRMVETEEELALLLVRGFSGEARSDLRAYLDEIVRSASDDDLVRLWNSACPDWYVLDAKGHRRFLALIRDKLRQGRTSARWRPVGEGHNHGRRVSRQRRASNG